MYGMGSLALYTMMAILIIICILLLFIQKYVAISRPIRFLIATIVPIVIMIITYVCYSNDFSDDFPSTSLIAYFPAVFVFGFISILFILNGKSPSNATLTCKNGHKCRVWINSKPYGFGRSYTQGGVVFDVGGEPIIQPENCPKCGAGWQKPHKHHKS